jgi:hypothetical protein
MTLLHGSTAGRSQPPQRHLREANVYRPPKLEHAVQRGDIRDRLAYAPQYSEERERLEHRLREVHYEREQCWRR